MKKVVFVSLLSSALLFGGESVISYDCKFPSYSSPDGLQKSKNFSLKYKIDTVSGKSYMIGNNGIGEVALIYNKMENSVTFIEITQTKNVTTTTISENGNAVHSRGIVMFKKLLPSQYYGTCSIELD